MKKNKIVRLVRLTPQILIWNKIKGKIQSQEFTQLNDRISEYAFTQLFRTLNTQFDDIKSQFRYQVIKDQNEKL